MKYTPLLLITCTLIVSEAIKWLGIFDNCVFQFPRLHGSVDKIGPYFYEIVTNNKFYHPVILDTIYPNNSSKRGVSSTVWRTRDTNLCRIRTNRLVAQCLVTFVQDVRYLLNLRLGLSFILREINPSYILLIVTDLFVEMSFYQNYFAVGMGTSKFVIVTENYDHFYIACIPCDTEPFKNFKISSLNDINLIWEQINKNLHKKVILETATLSWPIYKTSKCGANLYTFDVLADQAICTMSVMSEVYNFTTKHHKSKDLGAVMGSTKMAGTYIGFNYTFYATSNPKTVHEIVYDDFKFVIITGLTSGLSGFEAFSSPFDAATWTLVLTSCFLTALVVTVYQILVKLKTNCSVLVTFLDVMSLYLGQAGSGLLRIFGGNMIALNFTLTLWFFGGYILTENLYKGVHIFLFDATPPTKGALDDLRPGRIVLANCDDDIWKS